MGRKIAVMGYSGSGKSTLARQLSAFYGIPVLYLDTVQFESGWVERDAEEGRERVKAFMEQDGWVIDGNYSKFFRAERMEAADVILFLNFPRRICLPRAFRRYFANRGKSRESMAAGCEEKLDFAFIRWILWDGRTRRVKEEYAAICRKYPQKTVILKNPKQVREYCQSLGLDNRA